MQAGAAGRLGVLSREAQITQEGAKERGQTLKGTTPGPSVVRFGLGWDPVFVPSKV